MGGKVKTSKIQLARSGPKKRMGKISSRESVAVEEPKEEERGPRPVAKTEARRSLDRLTLDPIADSLQQIAFIILKTTETTIDL